MTSVTAETTINPPEQEKSRIPGEVGIWVFIFGDLLVFSLFFATFLFYRGDDPELFNHSQEQLNQVFGVLNTVVLLSSSWLVASAMHAARMGRERAPAAMFLLALACGAGFLVIKFFEYSEKIQAGITLNTNDFFMYYFVFTGIHAIHVLIGMGVLVYLTLYCRARRGAMTSDDIQTLESGSIFWHLVDLLWIVLFALLYLVR